MRSNDVRDRSPRREPVGRGPREPVRPRPDPCAPDADDDCPPCGCGSVPTEPQPAPEPVRPRPGKDDCCERILDAISRIPGVELPPARKPKRSAARNARNLCDTLGLRDALVPVLAVLWRRFMAGEGARGEFEYEVEKIFASLDEDQRAAMEDGFARYEGLRRSGRAECLWDDCLADAAREGAIEREWVARRLLTEGLKLAGASVMDNTLGEIGPGQARPWDIVLPKDPDSKAPPPVSTGPWPWLTAIRPDLGSTNEFGSSRSFRPEPGKIRIWQPYQFDTECSFAAQPNGQPVANCTRRRPPPPAPGDLFGPDCPGGRDYNVSGDCLRIPSQRPGQSILLRGFNWITPGVSVKFSRQGDPGTSFAIEAAVWGDRKTPAKDPAGASIVDERVSDCVTLSLPSGHPSVPGAPLPPGLYEVRVAVRNVTGASHLGSVAPVLESNPLLVRIEPDPNVRFTVWSQAGRCIDETSGPGSDEIWWDALTAHVVPPSVPAALDATIVPKLAFDHTEFPRGPWDDMDDGEGAGAYSTTVFGPAPFELNGVAAIGLIGFEVDDESLAREQIRDFGEAFWETIKSIAEVALAGESLIGTILKLTTKLSVGWTLVVLAAVAAVIVVAVAIWAAWGRADLIALDIFAWDPLSAWDATDPAKPVTPEERRDVGPIHVIRRPFPKAGRPNEAAATWIEERQYDCDEEGSRYVLEFRVARA